MVLRGGQVERAFAIGDDEEAGFLAGHELLDHEIGRGGAELAAQHVARFGFGLLQRVEDRDALAGGEAVGLEHIGRGEGFQEGLGGVLLALAEAAIGRRRHAVFHHALLGEGLGAFQLRSRLARPEHVEAARAQHIGDAGCQRGLRADDDEVGLDLQDELHHLADIGRADIEARADFVHAGIAGGAHDLVDQRRLGDFPGQGVFAPA